MQVSSSPAEVYNTTPHAEAAPLPENIGMQGGLGSWHHRAILDFFGIALDSARAVEAQSHLVQHETHDDLVASLSNGETDIAMIAVDNNNSGRVTSAIEALRRNPKLRILGKIALTIEQRLLLHLNHALEDIEQVASQRPALDQAAGKIALHEWLELERADTAGSAFEVAKADGIVEGFDGVKRPTAAIASELAGKLAGLAIGDVLSPPGNATTFWLVTSDPEKYEAKFTPNATHAAITFSVPNRKGSLLEMVRTFSEAGFDFTDIDSHLASEGDTRSFFAELKFNGDANAAKFKALVDSMREAHHEIEVLGTYEDRTADSVHTTSVHNRQEATTPAVHELWRSREGVTYDEGSPVVYVQATNQVGSLQGMLEQFDALDINLVDMSRPYMPDTNGSRGFYFVLEQGADSKQAAQLLRDVGYSVEQYTYRDEALEESAA
ncbi:hypothetical protein JNM87_00190 [Candidatus Saccharibacteria bacterium]|nr:hypothetical protein [Candidatus Saccharibacteria bacterium]